MEAKLAAMESRLRLGGPPSAPAAGVNLVVQALEVEPDGTLDFHFQVGLLGGVEGAGLVGLVGGLGWVQRLGECSLVGLG